MTTFLDLKTLSFNNRQLPKPRLVIAAKYQKDLSPTIKLDDLKAPIRHKHLNFTLQVE
jgi:hypothetical protein